MAEPVGTAFEKVQFAMRELAELCAPIEAEELAEVAAAAQALCNIAEHVRRLAFDEVARSCRWEDEGSRSPGRWLAHHAGAPPRDASAACRQAAALRSMPHSSAAALEGVLHAGHIEALTACHRAAPDEYTDEVDAHLVALAGDDQAFRAAIAEFRRRSAPSRDGAAASTFTLAQRSDGRHEGSLRLAEDDAAIVHAALDRRIARRLHAQRNGDVTLDGATIANLRAQALVDLCDADLRRDPRARRAPDRHRLAITFQADAAGTIAPVGHLPEASTCDVELFRLVLGAAGEVLDVGRATRTWSAAQADAIIRRDAHCSFPGCDAPPGWCDIHHCQAWEAGGATNISNGTLLCRWHHTFIHRRRWRVELDPRQRPSFTRPDGTVHTAVRPVGSPLERSRRCCAPSHG